MSHDLAKIAAEMGESQNQIVAESFGMANAILDGRVSEDISPKKKAATSSRDDGSLSKRQRRKKDGVESEGSGEDV